MMKAEDKKEMTSEEKVEEKPPYEKPSHCLICGGEGPALLYGHWISTIPRMWYRRRLSPRSARL